MELPDPCAAGDVVHPQRGPQRLRDLLRHRPVLGEHGDEERQHLHQVRRVAQQTLALTERLVHEPHVALLEVAQPAVHELRALRRGAGREVVALDERRAQARVTPRRAPRRSPVIPPPTTSTSNSRPRAVRSSPSAIEPHARPPYPVVTDVGDAGGAWQAGRRDRAVDGVRRRRARRARDARVAPRAQGPARRSARRGRRGRPARRGRVADPRTGIGRRPGARPRSGLRRRGRGVLCRRGRPARPRHLGHQGSWDTARRSAGAVLGAIDALRAGRVRRRVRRRPAARPPRRARPGDGVLPVQQRRDRRRQRSAAAASAWRSSTGTCTTATARRTSSTTTRSVLYVSTHQSPLYPGTGRLRETRRRRRARARTSTCRSRPAPQATRTGPRSTRSSCRWSSASPRTG